MNEKQSSKVLLNKSGYLGVLRNWLEGLKETSKRGYVSSYNIAQIHAILEDHDQAIAALLRSCAEPRLIWFASWELLQCPSPSPSEPSERRQY
jgi:hypothetical protein